MTKIHIDFETRATVDIKTVGGWAYAMHPDTEILCLAWAEDGDDPLLLTGDLLKTPPPYLPKDVQFVAHNAGFEYAIYHAILVRRYGWPAFHDPKHWDCTLSRAAACGLPLSLEKCAAAAGLAQQKDLKGRTAMLKLCKPVGLDPLGDPYFRNDANLLQDLYAYCLQDVRTEQALDRWLPPLSADERRVWELDLTINRRGVAVDVPLARKAQDLTLKIATGLNDKLNTLTQGGVSAFSRIAEMKRYLSTYGVVAEGLDKEAVTNLLANPNLPPVVREVLELRRAAGKSSTAKYATIVNTAGPDGRVRGVLQYHAAHTGRWGGRLIQPQNFPKGLDAEGQEAALKGIAAGTVADLDVLSGALRGMITAKTGAKLVAADFNAIEARVVFWLAGDQSALQTYEAGGSPYLDMGAYLFKRPIDKKKDAREYAISKATILGAGFGMGWVKFLATCQTNNIEGVTEEMAKAAVKAYREKYAAVPRLWREMEKAAVESVKRPGTAHYVAGGKVAWGMSPDGRFLVARLPSGRLLRYYKPRVAVEPSKFDRERNVEVLYYSAAGITGALEEFNTYGGSLTENVVQAVARDIMVNGMHKVEAAGYPIVLSVHDEVVAELAGEPALEPFIKALCDKPIWAATLPIAAEGFISERYRK